MPPKYVLKKITGFSAHGGVAVPAEDTPRSPPAWALPSTLQQAPNMQNTKADDGAVVPSTQTAEQQDSNMEDVADDDPVVPSMESRSIPPPQRLKQHAAAFLAAAQQNSSMQNTQATEAAVQQDSDMQNVTDDGTVGPSVETSDQQDSNMQNMADDGTVVPSALPSAAQQNFGMRNMQETQFYDDTVIFSSQTADTHGVDDGADNTTTAQDTTAAETPTAAPIITTAQATTAPASTAQGLATVPDDDTDSDSDSVAPRPERYDRAYSSASSSPGFGNEYYGKGGERRPAGYETPRAPTVESLTSPPPQPFPAFQPNPPVQLSQLPEDPAPDNSVFNADFTTQVFVFFSEGELNGWIRAIGGQASLVESVELRSEWEVYIDANVQTVIRPVGGVMFTEALRGLPNLRSVRCRVGCVMPWQRRNFPNHDELDNMESGGYLEYGRRALKAMAQNFRDVELNSETIVTSYLFVYRGNMAQLD